MALVSTHLVRSIRKRRARTFAATLSFEATPDAVLMSVDAASIVTESDLVLAIRSLYADRLQPYGRLVRKRLAELAGKNASMIFDVTVPHLQKICRCYQSLRVVAVGQADWYVVLSDEPSPDFVDIFSNKDEYSEELWIAAAFYFEGLGARGIGEPGGRYACALNLVGRGLPFLSGLCLGEVSHIVQLALTRRKLLGYRDGVIVPYCHSETMVRERCADAHRLCRQSAFPAASWDCLRQCLWALLHDMATGSCLPIVRGLPISKLKNDLRVYFHVELMETALGHASVSELLKDKRLEDICTLRLHENGYYIHPKPAPVIDAMNGYDSLQLRFPIDQCCSSHLVTYPLATMPSPARLTLSTSPGRATCWDGAPMAEAPAESDVGTDDEGDEEVESVAPKAETDAECMTALKQENERLREALREKDIAIERLTRLPPLFFGTKFEDGFNADKCDKYSAESTLYVDTESTVDASDCSLPPTPRLLAEPTPSPSNQQFRFCFCLSSVEASSVCSLDGPAFSPGDANDGDLTAHRVTETKSSFSYASNVIFNGRPMGNDASARSVVSHLMEPNSPIVVPQPR